MKKTLHGCISFCQTHFHENKITLKSKPNSFKFKR